MKRRIVCLLMVFALLTGVSVLAADGNGYLFRTAEPVTDEALLSRIAPISAERNLYRTDEYAVIRLLAAAGQLLYWEEDITVCLADLPEEAELQEAGLWTDAMLGIGYARENGITGEGVRIGLIDSGVRSDLGELIGANVAEGTNYLASAESPERTNTNDVYGHGSFVASIIGSATAGVAPEAVLIPLKCFDGKTGSISCIIKAIYDAVDLYRVDILNMSLGTANRNTSFYDAIRYAFEHNVIITAASGNLTRASTGNDPYYYPAGYDEVIGVGAVDESKTVASFSYQNDSVLVTAPGKSVIGLDCQGTVPKKGSGTSFATPFVTGAAALARSADPMLTPLEFADLLAETAEDLGEPGYDHAYGYGLLNIPRLLDTLCKNTYHKRWDGESGSLSVSAPVPASEDGYQVLLADYDSDGRFLGMQTLTAGNDRFIRELALPETGGQTVLMVIGQSSWTPLKTALRLEN